MSSRPIAIVLAGGEGAGFRSEAPQAVCPLLGESPLSLAVASARAAGLAKILVVFEPASAAARTTLSAAARRAGAEAAVLSRSHGSAGRVLSALAACKGGADADLLILPTLYPLLRPETLSELLRFHRKRRADLTILSAVTGAPAGFARVDRGEAGGVRIVPEGRASGLQLSLAEVASGIGLVKASALAEALRPRRGRGAAADRDWQAAAEALSRLGRRVEAFATPRPDELVPLARLADAARVRAALRDRVNMGLAERGVTIIDPATAWIDIGVRIGAGAVIAPFCLIEGDTAIGEATRIGPGCHIRDAAIGRDVGIAASTVIEEAVLEDRVSIGPFARLRPGTTLRRGAHVGNFVEMKKTDFGPGAKAGHLSYVGDSHVGEDVNIGAGTITCNYDGVRKNRTVIGAGAFIGSGSELVAPVTVGRGAYVAAGSVIVDDVPDDSLAIARGRQAIKDGWAKARREKIEREKSGTGA